MSSTSMSTTKLSNAISKIIGALLHGVAEATLKCMDYNNCIKPNSGIRGGSIKGANAIGANAIGANAIGANEIGANEIGANEIGSTGSIVTDLITDTGTMASDISNAFEGVDKSLITILKIIGLFTESIAPIIEKTIFGDLANKEWSEVAPQLIRILNDKRDYLNKISQDPILQQALKEWAEAYTIVGIQTIKALKPYIDQIIDEGLITLTDAGTKAGIGIVSTGMNFVEAAVGEIPVAGGIIDMVIAIVRGLNSVMVTTAPMVQYGIKTIDATYKTINNVNKIIQQGQETINRTSKKLQDITSGLKNVAKVGTDTLNTMQTIGQTIGTHAISNLQQASQNAVKGAVKGAVQGAVQGALQGAVQSAVQGAVQGNVKNALQEAVQGNVKNALQEAVQDNVQGVASKAISASNIKNILPQTGGVRKKINKTTKRIKKTLHNFKLCKKSNIKHHSRKHDKNVW